MATRAFGPLQLFVLTFPGEALKAVEGLDQAIGKTPVLYTGRQEGYLRLIDLVLVRKDADGKIDRLKVTDLTPQQRQYAGALAGGLVGLGAGVQSGVPGDGVRDAVAGAIIGAQMASRDYGLSDEEVAEVMRDVPTNTVVAVVIIEHVWAKNLMQAIADAGGTVVAQGMLTPEALIGLGATGAAFDQMMHQPVNPPGEA